MSSITQALNQTNNEFNAALSKQKGSNLDKDSFMLLLVTQFKYQDPLNPMDDKEFIAQMAQFSSLEQLMNLNTSMEGLTDATNNQQMINATSYIGKQVSVSGNTIGKTTTGKTEDSDGVIKVSTFRYAFGDNVAKGVLTVKDANGNPVYTEDVRGKASGTTFEFTWNGMTNSGAVAPDGVYTVSLAAYNADGEAVLSDQVVDATVTGVVNDNGTVYLGLDGGQLMALANVRQVSEPKVVNNGNNPETPPDEDNSNPENPDGGDSGNGENTETPGGENTEETTGQAA